jgi:hypothetical protein
MIDRHMAKHSLALGSPKVALLDLSFHDVNRARGLTTRWARWKVDRVVGTTRSARRCASRRRPPA